MKKLLIALAFIGSAQAQGIAWVENLEGGRIVLQSDTCYSPANGKYYKELRQMYSYTPTGVTIRGCWIVDDGMVWVVWEKDGSESRFPIDRFTLMQNSKTLKYQ